MMAKDDSGSGIVWFLAGAVTGAAVALLYAPKSGRDTRKYISKTTEKSKDALSESGKELVDRGKELYDRGRALADEAADLFERGRKLVKG
jgi:gas vesicle protein